MSATDAARGERDADDRLRELPPSAKLVYKVLEYDGSLTQGQLAEETLLPSRTVRYATSRLEDADVVESRFSFTDARKRIYSIRGETEGVATADASDRGATDADSAAPRPTTSDVLSEPL